MKPQKNYLAQKFEKDPSAYENLTPALHLWTDLKLY